VIAYDRSYFPTDLAARFDPESFDGPVLEAVRELAGSPVTWVDWEIEILPAPREAASALGNHTPAAGGGQHQHPVAGGRHPDHPNRAVLPHRSGEVQALDPLPIEPGSDRRGAAHRRGRQPLTVIRAPRYSASQRASRRR
jgi:hypothetical protein